MPPSTFGPGQWPFLNRRYHNRRNAYLAHVAARLAEPAVHKGLIKSVRVLEVLGCKRSAGVCF